MALPDVLDTLVRTRTQNASFPISHFDLFVNGLTNLARSLYFSMDVACRVSEANLQDGPWGLGEDEQLFLFNFVEFVVEQHLADVNFSDCLVDWHERQLQPTFLAPLTLRGRQLVGMIGQLQDAFTDRGQLAASRGIRVAQEGLIEMLFTPSHVWRLPLIAEIQRLYLETNPEPPKMPQDERDASSGNEDGP